MQEAGGGGLSNVKPSQNIETAKKLFTSLQLKAVFYIFYLNGIKLIQKLNKFVLVHKSINESKHLLL